jgi:proliferating cell nuclear antigen
METKKVFNIKNKLKLNRYPTPYDKSDQEKYDKYDKYFKKKYIGFKTENSQYFKQLISFIASITEQVNFQLTKDGIHISTMDSSHIALIDCLIPPSLFSIFNYSKEEMYDAPHTIWGVNMVSFLKILNQIKRDDELIIYQDMDNNIDTINITLRHEKYDKFYSLKLMNIDNDELCIHDIPDTTLINIDSKYFNDIIKDFADIGENLTINIENDNGDNDNGDNDNGDLDLCFECEGEMTCLKMVIHKDDIILENLKPLKSEYSLANMNIVSKGYILSDKLLINIGEDVPIKFNYTILDEGYINYYLAPKMTDY